MKAISPVIATVIIVAVAIAISIAVALWITGLTSSFTGVEKLEIINAYATGSEPSFTIYITVKNTGTKPATIDNIFINNKPLSDINGASISTVTGDVTATSTPFTLSPGEKVTIQLSITSGFTSGQTVSIIIHTASGGQYPATVTLP